MGLRAYLLKRTINTIILVFFVITLNFMIFVLMPGTQGSIQILTANPRLGEQNPELRELLIQRELERFGLSCGVDPVTHESIPCPIEQRYLRYLRSMLTFDFGTSFQTGNSVVHDIAATGRLVNTLVLLGVSSVISIIIGVFLGVIAARRRGTVLDNFWVTASLTTYSLPTFWMAMILILTFSFGLGWFPSAGVTPFDWVRPEVRPTSFLAEIPARLQHLFLPALTLTLFFYGGYLLLTRATMLETLSEDYITTARAKGLPERTVLYKHALKNASLPIITAAALQFGFLLTGAIITETVFSWDGLGKWLFDAIFWNDGPVLQAMFYIIALSVIVANFAADLVYGLVDPRIKYE